MNCHDPRETIKIPLSFIDNLKLSAPSLAMGIYLSSFGKENKFTKEQIMKCSQLSINNCRKAIKELLNEKYLTKIGDYYHFSFNEDDSSYV